MTFLVLLISTFVSEDLACITAGLLVQQGVISAPAAIASCAFGILIGDVALWGAGRLGDRAVGARSLLARWAGRHRSDEVQRWLDEHAGTAILVSRFLPGTRVPLYVCAGLTGVRARTFIGWSAVAVLAWTPLLVLIGAGFGGPLRAAVQQAGATGALSAVVTACAMLVALRAMRPLLTRAMRRKAWARIVRWSRWEFWPMWLFYAPVAAWVAWLSLRYGGLATITAANPGIPDGGTIGESKHRILSMLPHEWTIPSALVADGSPAQRRQRLLDIAGAHGWRFPIVLKPDVGQRGAGVKLAQTERQAEIYLARQRGPVLVQPYHPGPFEAGVFYYRFPGEARGRIFSITDKHFPVIVGDGRSSVEELVWAHPRYRLQAATFLKRHQALLSRVLEVGERLQLAIAGNHAQGTLFRDGMHLWTVPLERRFDEIARAYAGFFVGRFDVRYSDPASFMAGEELAIVELNGATAESTDIYDPARSLLDAYRRLFRQWSLVFAIGAANRAAGADVTPAVRLVTLIRAHFTSTVAFEISD